MTGMFLTSDDPEVEVDNKVSVASSWFIATNISKMMNTKFILMKDCGPLLPVALLVQITRAPDPKIGFGNGRLSFLKNTSYYSWGLVDGRTCGGGEFTALRPSFHTLTPSYRSCHFNLRNKLGLRCAKLKFS